MKYATTVIGLILMIFYIRKKVPGASVPALFLKMLTSVFFLLTALIGLAKQQEISLFGCLITGGLILGLCGDVLLDLKYIYPQDDSPYTYSGFITFAIGHLFYIAAMAIRFRPFTAAIFLLIPISLAVGIFVGTVWEKIAKLTYGHFRIITIIYVSILFYTTALSCVLCIQTGFTEPSLLLLFPALVLFCISDSILCLTFFGIGKDRPIDIIFNYCTYYPAQFLIALSIL